MVIVTHRSARRVLVGAASALVFALCSTNTAALTIKPLSSGADYVSGGDALLEIKPATVVAGTNPVVTVGGVNQSSRFVQEKIGNVGTGRWIGKVDGLAEYPSGATTVHASYAAENTSIDLRNFAIVGPVISGPHEEPFICNHVFKIPGGSNVYIEINDDEDCTAPETVVQYLFYNTSNKFQILSNWENRTTYPTTMKWWDEDETIPYIVRLETGTINRAIYQIAVLHDVVKETGDRTRLPAPPARIKGPWNGKLIYKFGGGCEPGWYTQGRKPIPDVLDDNELGRGYAIATSTLNVAGNNCNDLLSSETVMMVKERFIENFGVPLFTIGIGSSGGSYQSNQTGDNYPGLLDGIITRNTFADVNSSILYKAFDSKLLNNYFVNKRGLTAKKRRAISGYKLSEQIGAMATEANRIDPTIWFPEDFPPEDKYHPVNNDDGVRGSVYDHTKNVYGTTSSGYGNRPINNQGVQYGLKALLDDVINGDEFVHLNKTIGGLTRDLLHQGGRTGGDDIAIARAYASGRFLWGGNGLKQMPIIDLRNYKDGITDIHASIHSFSVRDRLIKANGDADNQVILRSLDGEDFMEEVYGVDVLAQMDLWLTRVTSDTSSLTLAQKVRTLKPTNLKDGCKYQPPTGPMKIVWQKQEPFETTECGIAFPTARTPRIVAGGNLNHVRDDVVRCHLNTSPTIGDYGGKLNQAQLDELTVANNSVFHGGVCDYSKPGYGQPTVPGTPQSLPWYSFGDSPVTP